MHAWLLSPDNFTPPSRTPWGGTAIVSRYKRELGLPPSTRVGESWELSAGPEFPSRVAHGRLLSEVVREDPDFALGDEAARGDTSLLVKLLDAEDNLSVQIHPSDDYAGLAADECGKPESWYVLDAAEGAGLYLGLAEGASPEAMRATLNAGGDASKLLAFVPVERGDFFVVEAGTAHAIGRGVTLVEPQVVRPGRKGVTYRYWDWNRRYDARGNASATGDARPLHVDHALAVTDWSRARGDVFLREIRVRSGGADLSSPIAVTALCGPTSAPLGSRDLEVSKLAGRGSVKLAPRGRLRALTVAEGRVDIIGAGGAASVTRGRTAAIAARAEVTLASDGGVHALLSCAVS